MNALGGWSLRRRLLGWLLISTAVLGLLALADTWREALLTAQGVSDRVLAGSALAIAERVAVDVSGSIEVDIPYSALEMLASTAEDQVFYRVDGPDGFLTGYDQLVVLPRAVEEISFGDGAIEGVGVRIATLYRQVSTGDASLPFSVTVAESTLARDALARAILWRSALRLLVMIVGAAVIVWITVTLALRPLDQLGRAISARAPDDLSPLQAAVPAEVAGLIGAMNSFMQRLDKALIALRNFTGNAGHQLRTPLATVRAQLVLAGREDGHTAARAEGLAKAEQALERAERVLSQLLMLARIDAAAARASLPMIDLAQVAREVTGEAIPLAAQGGHDLGYEGLETLEAQADPILCAELLRNLVDNALRYGGPGARITVRSGMAAEGAFVEVEDDGPGIPHDRLPGLTLRRDLRADRDAGVHGLGLGVVAEIAALFGATLAFRAPDGGRGQIVRCQFGRD